MIFLIADDSARMRASITRHLRMSIPDLHSVVEASDGVEAIAMYERTHPDWVLMDIRMEPMDGLAASRTIMAAYPDAKIIILTNYNDDVYRSAAMEAGVRGFLLKEHLDDITTMISGRADE